MPTENPHLDRTSMIPPSLLEPEDAVNETERQPKRQLEGLMPEFVSCGVARTLSFCSSNESAKTR